MKIIIEASLIITILHDFYVDNLLIEINDLIRAQTNDELITSHVGFLCRICRFYTSKVGTNNIRRLNYGEKSEVTVKIKL